MNIQWTGKGQHQQCQISEKMNSRGGIKFRKANIPKEEIPRKELSQGIKFFHNVKKYPNKEMLSRLEIIPGQEIFH